MRSVLCGPFASGSGSGSVDSFQVLVRWKVTPRRASRPRNASRPIRITRPWTVRRQATSLRSDQRVKGWPSFRPGERDLLDERMGHQRLTGGRPGPGDHVQGALGKPCLKGELGQAYGRQRGQLRGLERRVPRRQGGCELDRGLAQGEVPGRDGGAAIRKRKSPFTA
ncbi:hypothetical protein SMALA_8136 [Streptomyces malaysiensis subsp. malaysiensis]|nr:hypothetical protein SMALA_8136 [Streptomyces malaysiensis]